MDASYRPASECPRVTLPLATDAIAADERETHRDTGLLDEHGRPLFRVERKRPIGFVHFGDDA